MRWILCGKNRAAVAALECLSARGDEVWAIGSRGDDGEDGWQPSFQRAARRLGVRFDRPPRIDAPDTVRELAAFGARALLSIQYDQILHAPLFEGIGCPCLNLHFSLLPRHRGVAPIAWAILSGDREAGCTLHHMVEGIDAGDLLARKAVPVGPEETARELYDRVSEAAAALFRECLPFDDALLASRLAQDDGQAIYHRAGDFDFSQRRVDWSLPAQELQRWLRAMVFPPLQHPELRLGGRLLQVTAVGAPGGAVGAEPGTVVERTTEGVRVACGGGTILLRGLVEPGRADGTADAALASLRVGERLA